MAENIKFKFQTCTHCSQQKTLPTQTAYLGNTQSSKTLAQIHIDFLSLELEEKKKKTWGHIMVTSNFSQYT